MLAAHGKFHPSTDDLRGTDVYGTKGTSDAWSIKYDDWTFSHYLFRTVNENKWMVTTTAFVGDPRGVVVDYPVEYSWQNLKTQV